MPDRGVLQFKAVVEEKATLWEENEIIPDNPVADIGMRLLRAEARAVQQEAATQAVTYATRTQACRWRRRLSERGVRS